MNQRDLMRKIWKAKGQNPEAAAYEFAQKEELGEVERKSNLHSISPLSYAKRLVRDGLNKGWLK